MKQILYCLWIIIMLAVSGCGSSSNENPEQSISTISIEASNLPLLSKGQHLAFIKGFNSNLSVATENAMNARFSEAVAMGMDVGRLQVDWSELEFAPNQYDKQTFENNLIELESEGLQPFVTLSTIDSEGFTIPADLTDTSSSTFLVNNINFDDPLILTRFNQLLDWVVPMIKSHGGWVLSVGNEPGNFLVDHPEAQQSFVNFLGSAREYSHKIEKGIAITMTLAYLNIEAGFSFHQDFIAQSDVVCFNYYASTTDVQFENDPLIVNAEIDQMLEVAASKQIIFQELGAAGGFEDRLSVMGASLSGQEQFFDTFFKRMALEPRLRVAVIFQLVDWDPTLVDEFFVQQFIAEGLPQDFIDRFAESLETTGLIRFADGSSRPAWTRVLEQIAKFSN